MMARPVDVDRQDAVLIIISLCPGHRLPRRAMHCSDLARLQNLGHGPRPLEGERPEAHEPVAPIALEHLRQLLRPLCKAAVTIRRFSRALVMGWIVVLQVQRCPCMGRFLSSLQKGSELTSGPVGRCLRRRFPAWKDRELRKSLDQLIEGFHSVDYPGRTQSLWS